MLTKGPDERRLLLTDVVEIDALEAELEELAQPIDVPIQV
jgi:hypothetical protein